MGQLDLFSILDPQEDETAEEEFEEEVEEEIEDEIEDEIDNEKLPSLAPKANKDKIYSLRSPRAMKAGFNFLKIARMTPEEQSKHFNAVSVDSILDKCRTGDIFLSTLKF